MARIERSGFPLSIIPNEDLNIIYNAMKNEDLSECVVVTLKVLEERDIFLKAQKIVKCNNLSLIHFARGKNALASKQYQNALKEFNAALMFAPLNSKEMVMAYIGRSELLFETEQFSACLKDIETCLAINSSVDIKETVESLKLEALKALMLNNTTEESGILKQSSFCDEFFNIPNCNSDVPCVTADMQVITEAQQLKVVAARDIPVGTVVARDTAFVNTLNEESRSYACHYCLKLSLNLIPCDNCCFVLFCDKNCKERSIQNGHDIECKIMNSLNEAGIKYTAPVKAVIKMRKACESWNEFITATQHVGHDQMVNNSADIYGRDKFSLLYSHKEQHFIHGAMFNASIIHANSIHYLDKMTDFLPRKSDAKDAAIRALSRTLMYLTLYSPPLLTRQNTNIINNDFPEILYVPNMQYFPFIGKVNHSCIPNTYVVTMGNTGALVAAMPIKKGSELTICYINHWTEERREYLDVRAEKLFSLTKIVCDCPVCRNDKILYNQPIKTYHKTAFLHFILNNSVLGSPIESEYIHACKTLQLLYDVPYSREYVNIFERLIAYLIRLSVYNFRNTYFM